MSTTNKAPTHRAYIVENYTAADRTEKSRWTEIGTVWTHEDGDGFNVVLTAFPVNGRLVIRKPLPPKDQAEQG